MIGFKVKEKNCFTSFLRNINISYTLFHSRHGVVSSAGFTHTSCGRRELAVASPNRKLS